MRRLGSHAAALIALAAAPCAWLSLPATDLWAQSGVKQTGKRPAPAGVAGPADYESAHFLMHTDLAAKEAQELLKRLETMLELISKYWAHPPVGVIEMYVVRDLDKWPAGVLEPHGRAKIEEGAGVTQTESLTVGGPGGTRQRVASKSVVFAVADHGTPQHEAVHAYCGQTFGTTGPLWYSEGMAEMGQYWSKDDPSVHIEPVVLRYLTSTRPQSLREIVDTNSERSFTGDSWQNYAWRWALCHMLANNTNYRDRFRPLGLGFLAGQKVSFEETYGAMAAEISFEYLFFVEHLEQGLRADLLSWDWKKKFKPLFGSSPVTAKIIAGHGWQPTGVTCAEGEEYDYAAPGTWQTSKTSKDISADGNKSGEGRLVGVLMQEFKLGKPFELGSYGTFKAPAEGKLYLRCQDKWNELADNKGAITVKLKLGGRGTPLARPKGETPSVLGEPSPVTKPAVKPAGKTELPRPSDAPQAPPPGTARKERPTAGSGLGEMMSATVRRGVWPAVFAARTEIVAV